MADIELVVKIPEGLKSDFESEQWTALSCMEMKDALEKATPLPKGHGRLIDADKFLKDNEAYTGWILNSSDWGGKNAYKDALEDLVDEADTIIEKDREDNNGNNKI